jgi:hypothetical protein
MSAFGGKADIGPHSVFGWLVLNEIFEGAGDRMRTAHQFCQGALALLDWRTPQIFAVEFDQVGLKIKNPAAPAVKREEEDWA